MTISSRPVARAGVVGVDSTPGGRLGCQIGLSKLRLVTLSCIGSSRIGLIVVRLFSWLPLIFEMNFACVVWNYPKIEGESGLVLRRSHSQD